MIWRYYVHYHEFNRRMDEWVSHIPGRVFDGYTWSSALQASVCAAIAALIQLA